MGYEEATNLFVYAGASPLGTTDSNGTIPDSDPHLPPRMGNRVITEPPATPEPIDCRIWHRIVLRRPDRYRCPDGYERLEYVRTTGQPVVACASSVAVTTHVPCC